MQQQERGASWWKRCIVGVVAFFLLRTVSTNAFLILLAAGYGYSRLSTEAGRLFDWMQEVERRIGQLEEAAAAEDGFI